MSIPPNPLDALLARAIDCTGRFITRHPRSLTAAVTLGLGGFAATAFGLAPLAPDAADLPRRVISEAVQTTGLDAQLDALAEHTVSLYRSDITRPSDTVDSLLRRLGVSDRAAAEFLRTDATGRGVMGGRAGKMVQVRAGAGGDLQELVARFPAADSQQLATHFTRLRITRTGERLVATSEQAPLSAQVRLGSGTIRNSLFAATDEARLPDSVASQLADIFTGEIDFHRELRRGDTFSVIYETMTADGEPISWNSAAGRVVAAEFVNNGKTHSALWFNGSESADAGSKGAYYDLEGRSKKASFLACPLEFSRVTSGFAMRFHPILGSWRQHAGVDYGAPAGTPVRAVGDGVVDYAGWQNGYGNVVAIVHSPEQSTVYAHLSRIDVRRGERVEQSERIGAVGATGWATGPHLHFEFKVNGAQIDPLLMSHASGGGQALAAPARARLALLARSMRGQLEAAEAAAGGRGADYAE